jgi:hypothetical protein
MKMNITTAVAALGFLLAIPTFGGEVVIKKGHYSPPAKSLFETPAAVPIKIASCCKEEFAPTTTQDSKLKTKTVLVAKHGCNSCSTKIVTVGAQKAGLRTVVEHSCAGKPVSVAICCDGMSGMK